MEVSRACDLSMGAAVILRIEEAVGKDSPGPGSAVKLLGKVDMYEPSKRKAKLSFEGYSITVSADTPNRFEDIIKFNFV